MAGDDYDDDSELGHAHGNVKIYRNGNSGASWRIVLAWAATATLLVIAVIGVLWNAMVNQQAKVDAMQDQRLDTMQMRQLEYERRISRMETQLENINRGR